MADVAWSEQALTDLDDIVTHIETADPHVARRLHVRLSALADSLADFPHRGRPTVRGLRELVTVPPYVIRYQVEGDVATIMRVRHGRRRPLP